MNLSSRWPTSVWLQFLLHPYQLIVACCNLFSCNGAIVLCVCCHITIIVAITVIVIVKWHWRLDTFNGQQRSSLCWGSRWAFALEWQGGHKSTVAQGLYQRSSARSDISCAWNMMSLLLFFPTKANLWYKGWLMWWLWSQMLLSSCGALGFQDWWQLMLTRLVTLASEYHCFLGLAAWTTWLSGRMTSPRCTLQTQGVDCWCSMHRTM